MPCPTKCFFLHRQVALKKFVIDGLSTLFCPGNILDIEDEMVATLAAEDEESLIERRQCGEKLRVLENGMRELKNVQEFSSTLSKGK
jgi:hypothetical protein